MKQISSEQFSSSYRFIRKQPEPCVGDWSLYKHTTSGEKRMIKELRFFTPQDLEDYLPHVTECPLYNFGGWDGTLSLLEWATKEERTKEGKAYVAYFVFEGYEYTLEKLVMQKIKDSQSFSIPEIFKYLKRIVSILEVLELNGYGHGDIRFSNIAILDGGIMKLIWAPFMQHPVKLMQDKPHLIKAMNPAPEIIQAFKEAELDRVRYSTYQDMHGEVTHSKADQYSTAILVLRLIDLFSTQGFYDYSPELEINTRRIESAVIKINSLNPKLSKVLNNLLVYDCFQRPSFDKITLSLSSPLSFTPQTQPKLSVSPSPSLLPSPSPSPSRSLAPSPAPLQAPSQGSIFASRGLQKQKNSFIAKLEKMMFFAKNGAIREGVKMKQQPAGAKYVGQMFAGDRHGLGIAYFNNGDVGAGAWERGEGKGPYLSMFADGAVFVGCVEKSVKNGVGKYLYANGDVYEGMWSDDRKNGRGVYSYWRGEEYDGEWRAGVKEGWGVFRNPGGEWIEAEWRGGEIVREISSGFEEPKRGKKDGIVEFYLSEESQNEVIDEFRKLIEGEGEEEEEDNTSRRKSQTYTSRNPDFNEIMLSFQSTHN